MELIGIELTEFTRRSRSILLKHCDLALDRVLLVGERVVLWEAVTSAYHSGTVVDTDVVGDGDLRYRLEVGLRLPEGIALDRVTGMSPDPSAPSSCDLLDTHEVLALLRQLRFEHAETRPRGLAHDR
ncbi:hypothetical protein [Nocardioides alcanivorans]|uniref:hypothetical protein n=1 Tax=Nocardioides alcanivorans TaxID=2897352 RepID=UPI001F2BB646|nr:hypothetical protein [Nocardioides alcanivorans]